MSQPYKVCSRCGQPAVLHMVRCGRCGLTFPPIAQAPPPQGHAPQGYAPPGPRLSAASQREVASQPVAAPPRRRSSALPYLLLLAFLLLFVIAGALLMKGVRQAAGGGPLGGLADTGAHGGGVGDPTGLFRERSSTSEMPTIVLTNAAEGVLTLVLRAPDGKEYTGRSRAGEETRFKVPPGHYTVSVTNDQPWIRPNYGDATFKRFTEYDATFVVDTVADPIHLGD